MDSAARQETWLQLPKQVPHAAGDRGIRQGERRMNKWVLVSALGIAVLAAGGAGAATLVDSGDIENRSIKTKDLAGRTVNKLRGNEGPQGPAGITNLEIVEATASYCGTPGGGACSIASATATCPEGTVATGGSAMASTIDAHITTDVGSDNYFAVIDNGSDSPGDLRVRVVCASGPGVSAAGASASSANHRSLLQQLRDAKR
jgi:hypothetical protein